MTQEDESFLRAIYAAPDDDAPRLVFADVLLERGDPRGELIILQTLPSLTPAQAKRRKRLENDDELVEKLAFPLSRGGRVVLQRGFPYAIFFSEDADLVLDEPAHATIRCVHLGDVSEEVAVEILEKWGRIEEVHGLTTAMCRRLPYGPRAFVRVEVIGALPPSEHLENWTRLRCLHVYSDDGTRIDRSQLGAIPDLEELALVGNFKLTKEHFAKSRGLARLVLQLPERSLAPDLLDALDGLEELVLKCAMDSEEAREYMFDRDPRELPDNVIELLERTLSNSKRLRRVLLQRLSIDEAQLESALGDVADIRDGDVDPAGERRIRTRSHSCVTLLPKS